MLNWTQSVQEYKKCKRGSGKIEMKKTSNINKSWDKIKSEHVQNCEIKKKVLERNFKKYIDK